MRPPRNARAAAGRRDAGPRATPEQRRRGVGARLVREAAARLRARGVPKLNLQVRGHDRDVVPFYEALGFVVEDRVSLGLLLEEA